MAAEQTEGEIPLPNPNLSTLEGDTLYHIGYSKDEAKTLFHDVKYVVMGGSSGRMKSFAEVVSKETNFPVENMSRGDRFVLYKVGPVLSGSHGMGVPSITIFLHEMIKLVTYAGATDTVFIRIGTSGGIGVPPGTVVISNKTFNGFLNEEHEIVVLGKKKVRPAVLDQELAAAILRAQTETDRYQTVLGGTMCTDDFFEGQGRLDGAVCEHTEAEKMEFLERAREKGVCNIEMECTALSSLCRLTGYKCSAVCVTLLDRIKGDQVDVSPEDYKEFGMRPQTLVAHFITAQLQLNQMT